MNERRKHSPEFKAKVALEALKNQMTLSELSSKYDVNPHVIHKWKNEFLSKAPSVFGASSVKSESGKEVDNLYNQIGRLKMENDWLKKNCRRI